MLRIVFGIVLALGVASLSAPARGQLTEAENRRVTRIARTTQSPFCPGKTLDACPSPSAAEWRADIRAWVEEGVPEREVRERLQARAPQISLDGQPMGESSWWLPAIAGLLATGVLLAWCARYVRRMPPAEEPEASADDTPGLDDRLQRELDGLDV